MFGPSKRSLLRTLEREREAHAAQVQQLVETICHLSDRPLPEKGWARDTETANGDQARRLIADPSQLPKH